MGWLIFLVLDFLRQLKAQIAIQLERKLEVLRLLMEDRGIDTQGSSYILIGPNHQDDGVFKLDKTLSST